jgi:hypothetical protein
MASIRNLVLVGIMLLAVPGGKLAWGITILTLDQCQAMQNCPGTPAAAGTGVDTSLSEFNPLARLSFHVLEGAVILIEQGTTDNTNPANWSDVINFLNGPFPFVATVLFTSDAGCSNPTGECPGESGGLSAGNITDTTKPIVAILESPADTTGAELNKYTVGGITYNITSDTPGPTPPADLPEPPPGSLLITGTGVIVFIGWQRRLHCTRRGGV